MSIYSYLLFGTRTRYATSVIKTTVPRDVFQKSVQTKSILVKFQTFSFKPFTFQATLPDSIAKLTN